jgi:hypothetical protein
VTGGGTEDVNARAIAGAIVTSDGVPASETFVRLCPSNYNPVADSLLSITFLDTTDGKGAYRFIKLDTGTYSLQAVQNYDRTRLLIENIHVTADSITKVSTHTLLKPGKIEIMLPDSFDAQTGYVYVPGTAMKSFIRNASGFAEIDSVPAGTIGALYYGARKTAPYSIKDTIKVLSGDSATFSMGPWAHSMKLFLNTSPSGANISGNVRGFPVLIRLTKSTSFDFPQARNNGEDVRFLKSDNTFLRYEIERWDAAQGQALLWVRVDTILGNNGAQYITMCWGNPGAGSQSDGAGVFDTAQGFAAVWHFNHDCGDATAGKNTGTNHGATDTAGIIGNSMKFHGADSIRVSGLLGSPAGVTLSAWAQMDSNAGGGGEILSIGDAASLRLDDARPGFGVEGCFHLASTNTDTTFGNVKSGVTTVKTGWRHVVLTFDNATLAQTLYIDGKAYPSAISSGAINYSGVGTNTLIGKHGNGKTGFNFIGRIDEARVNKIALSADWIKLCYMNQKDIDALVVFKP